MSAIISRASKPIELPSPRVPISIRLATTEDFAFIDSLQSRTTMQVGWMPRQQIEGKIRAGQVLVAESSRHTPCAVADGTRSVPATLGYVIGQDQYFKRDDVGIVYALNVVEEHRRSFIGAALLKAMFERAAYGCRLFCCWCAQDIAANRFWEAMGFVPLAFRAGGLTKGPARRGSGRAKKTPRVHIFWQKRIRAGDDATPWWFPSQTSGGSIREDRLVFPIPPGTHWADVMPIVLPTAGVPTAGVPTAGVPTAGVPGAEREADEPKAIASSRDGSRRKVKSAASPRTRALGGWSFSPPAPAKSAAAERAAKPRRKVKNDPRLVAAARELRDRWLENLNSGQNLIEVSGKYQLGRTIEPSAAAREPLLIAA